MRTHGEGTIEKVMRDGKLLGYRGRMMVEGKRISGPLTKRRKDALPQLYAKLNRLARESSTSQEQTVSLFAAATMLLENRLIHEWKTKTVDLGRCTLKKIEHHEIGEMSAVQISDNDIIDWRNGLNLSPSTKKRYQRILEQFIKHLGGTARAPKQKLPEPDIQILTPLQQKDIVERCVQPRTRIAIKLLLYCGLRAGEACGLRHEDRYEDGIFIRRQVQYIPVEGEIKRKLRPVETKTDESRAWLHIDDPELLEHIGPPNKGYVLETAKGTPMAAENLARMVKSVAEKTPYAGVSPHDLRHTCAVNMLRAGIDPRTVASITRHSVDTLLKIYHRVSPAGKIEAAQKLKAWRIQAEKDEETQLRQA